MLTLIITYLWIGPNIPEDYLVKFGSVNYPVQIYINPPTNYDFSLNIMKADRYRLELLKDGGVYSDFDATIRDYNCLMKVLSNFTGEMLIPHFEWNNKLSNGFIYVPHNNTGLVRQMLENEGKNCDSITKCHGPQMFYKYKDRITTSKEINKCISHNFDWSWWKDSQIVNKGKNWKPHQKLINKSIKKEQIKVELAETLKKLNQTMEKLAVVEENLTIANEQKQQLQKRLEDLEKNQNFDKQTNATQLTKENKKNQAQIDIMKKQLEDLKKKLKQTEEEKAKSQSAIKTSSEKEKASNAAIGTLNKELEDLKKKLKQTEEEKMQSQTTFRENSEKINAQNKGLLEKTQKELEELRKKFFETQDEKLKTESAMKASSEQQKQIIIQLWSVLATLALIVLLICEVRRRVLKRYDGYPIQADESSRSVGSNSL